MISPNLVDEILKRADIVQVISTYLNVIKKGNTYYAICPFHADTNPSMHISPEKQIYKCFACGAGGNVINFVQNYEHISFFDAVRKVAEIIGYSDENLSRPERKVDEKTKNVLTALKEAKDIYKYLLKSRDGEECAKYLEDRHISSEMQEYFDLGYSSKNAELSVKLLRGKNIQVEALEEAGIIARANGVFVDRFSDRLIFPIYNEYSEVIGYSARKIDSDPNKAKYINSTNTVVFNKSQVLYNYQNAKKEAKKEGCVYVTEGFMDVFALYTAGIKSAIALMGTAFTQYHAKLLRKLNVEIRLCLDGDQAGQHGMLLASEILDKEGVTNYKVVNYEDCVLDPDEILQQKGPKELKDRVSTLISKDEFIFNYYAKQFDLSKFEGKKQFANALIPYVSKMNNPIDREMMIKSISYKTGIETRTILSLVKANDSYKEPDFNEIISAPSRNVSPLKLRRLQRVQNAIMTQLLLNTDALVQMEESGEYFIDSMLLKIYNYVIDYYQTNQRFEVADLISFLSLNNDDKSKAMIEKITGLISVDNVPEYTPELMGDYLEVLKSEINEKRKKDYVNNTILNSTTEEAAEKITNYFKQTKGEN